MGSGAGAGEGQEALLRDVGLALEMAAAVGRDARPPPLHSLQAGAQAAAIAAAFAGSQVPVAAACGGYLPRIQ